MKYFTYLMLLGLTKAQLGVFRSKSFTMGSLTPMQRILNIGDNVRDDLILNVQCDDGTNERNFYYNGITKEDVDTFLCPAYYTSPEENMAFGDLSYSPDDKTCSDVMNSFPSDNNQITSHTTNDQGYYIEQTGGSLICLGEADVEFKLYKQGMAEWNTVEEMYDLRTYQYACIEDDNIEIIFLFGMRDFWEGADMCFDNSPYVDLEDQYAAPDFPFVVDNNCYESSWYQCHNEGYKLKVHVVDHEEANLLAGLDWPIRLPKMYVKVTFDRIYDYFQIFPDDKAKVSLYLSGRSDPQSVVISPADYVQPVCEPDVIADTITCNNLDVYCREPTDDITLRIVAAGEILIHEVTCSDLVAAGFDYVLKNTQLTSDNPNEYALYEETVGPQDNFEYIITQDQHGVWISTLDGEGAKLKYEYGTFIKSQDQICFTGDFFPFSSPSCKLQNKEGGEYLDVNTRIHNANEYQIDDAVIELVVNQDFDGEGEQEFNVYQTGQPVTLTDQIQNAITGEIDTDYLNQAIPSQLMVTNLPSCGVLTREGTTVSEENFAMFWTYTTESDYSIVIKTGDVVNLDGESIIFEGADTCDELVTSFGYITSANMPVDGATTTGYLRQAEGAGAEKLTATTIGLSAFMSAKLSQLF